MAFPTDARLYQKMRLALVMQGRYARARQMRRAARETRRLKIWLGRVVRDIERKLPTDAAVLRELLPLAKRLLAQQRHDSGKLYSVHAPEVECIAKGKAHQRYEFGCKVSLATTSKGNWLVAAASLAGNPYDGHTLEGALAQIERLTGRCPTHAYCDRGYRGHGVEGDTRVHLVGKIPKKATRTARKWMKRRAAIEPTIGHLKSDHRLSRNHLKGSRGDRANVVLAAAGYNFAKLLAGFSRAWRKFREIFLSGATDNSLRRTGCPAT